MVHVRQIKCPSCGRRLTPDGERGTTCPDCGTRVRTPVPARSKVIRLAVVTLILVAAATYLATHALTAPLYGQREYRDADGVVKTRPITDEREARNQIQLNRALAVAGYGDRAAGDAEKMERTIVRVNRVKRLTRLGFALCSLGAICLIGPAAWMIHLRRRNLLSFRCPACEALLTGSLDQLATETLCPSCGHAFTVPGHTENPT